MKKITAVTVFSLVILLCSFLNTRIAEAQDFLVGNWTLVGADFTALGLNLSGGTNPYLVISKSGATYNAHLSQDIFVSEVGCQVSSTLNLLAITPVSTTDLNIVVTYPIPIVCINVGKSQEVLISNLATDQNSFTSCRADKPTDCTSWVRLGTTVVDPGSACSASLTPTAPTATVSGKNVTVTVPVITGVKRYTYALLSKKNSKTPTTKISVISTKGTIKQKQLGTATWGVRFKATCTAGGTSKFSPYTGFTIK